MTCGGMHVPAVFFSPESGSKNKNGKGGWCWGGTEPGGVNRTVTSVYRYTPSFHVCAVLLFLHFDPFFISSFVFFFHTLFSLMLMANTKQHSAILFDTKTFSTQSYMVYRFWSQGINRMSFSSLTFSCGFLSLPCCGFSTLHRNTCYLWACGCCVHPQFRLQRRICNVIIMVITKMIICNA